MVNGLSVEKSANTVWMNVPCIACQWISNRLSC